MKASRIIKILHFSVLMFFVMTINSLVLAQVNYDSSGFEINGTVSAKAFNLNGDIITSWPPGGGSEVWTTSGKNVYRETGNIGIGTTEPNAKLHIYEPGGTVGLRVESGRDGIPVIVLNKAATNHKCSKICYLQNGIECFALGYDLWGENADVFTLFDSKPGGHGPVLNIRNGNVGIGTRDPQKKLEIDLGWELHDDALIRISGGYNPGLEIFSKTNWHPRLRLVTNDGEDQWEIHAAGSWANKSLVFSYNGSDKIAMANTGNLGIGLSNPGYKLHVIGDIAYTGNLYDVSDIRLKENIEPIENALEKVSSINGIYFNNIGDPPEKREIGVLAQDVERVLPEVVSENDEGYKSVDYSKLTPLLIETVKALKAENEALKQEIEQIKEAIGL